MQNHLKTGFPIGASSLNPATSRMSNGINKNGVHNSDINDDDEKKLLLAFDYIKSLPRLKNARLKLAVAFNHWLKVGPEIFDKICDITEMLHNSSLLIDDIEDNSEMRRGQPSAHKIFGVPHTINSANYVYFIALDRVLALNNSNAVKVFSEQMLDLHQGQGMEIYWRDTFQCPTEAQYRNFVTKKTGGLFMLAIRLLQLFSEDQRDLTKLVSLLGLFFQIRDDYANLKFDSYCKNKTFCEDLTEGKFSFPIIHAMTKFPTDLRIPCILQQRTTNTDLKKYVVSLLDEFGSFAYTEETLQKLDGDIRAEIRLHGGNSLLEALVDQLSYAAVPTHVNGSSNGTTR